MIMGSYSILMVEIRYCWYCPRTPSCVSSHHHLLKTKRNWKRLKPVMLVSKASPLGWQTGSPRDKLLLWKTGIGFPAPTSGSSCPPINPAPGDSVSLASEDAWTQPPCHIHIIKLLQKWILRKERKGGTGWGAGRERRAAAPGLAVWRVLTEQP